MQTFLKALPRPILAAAILTTFATVPLAAQAQDLIVGSYTDPSQSGTATLTDTGTTVSGTYTYFGTEPLAGRSIYDEWDLYGPSTANIEGGRLNTLALYDTSTANVSGGRTDSIATLGTSTANVTGGDIHDLQTFESSTANVSGGSIVDVFAFNTSTANVTGGNVFALAAGDNGVLDLFGTGLSASFLDSYHDPEYKVYGTLLNGDPLDAIYYDLNGTLEFNGVPVNLRTNPVPEASTTASFGLLLALGLGGVIVAVKRKKAGSAA